MRAFFLGDDELIASNQIRFIRRLIFLLVCYFFLRLGFYFYHYSIFNQFSDIEIFKSFILGMRFDLSAIILINSPIILFSLVQANHSRILTFERLVFVVLNSTALLAGLNDFELFLFMGKRLSYDLFFITNDIMNQLPQLIINFWFFPLIALIFSFLFYQFDKKFDFVQNQKKTWTIFLGNLIFLALAFIGVRGGLQYKSINIQSAFVQGKNELGHLVLNTPYHFLRTLKNKSIKKISYFKTDDEAKLIILKNRKDYTNDFTGLKNANVVLIILESFALEYVEKGLTPFLSELKNKGHFFELHLANGRRSIEALPSLLCGLPSLLSEPISKSIYSGNKFNCFPKILKKAGYTNYFFHAGVRGTMGFEAYTLASGFDQYFSKEDYGDKDYDGTWGVFDLPYLQYVVKNISQMKTPFLAGIFTLTSHQPYKIPKEFHGKFPVGSLDIHESIGYTDFALRKFFESAEKEDWFNNTFFIITSDHTQKLETKKYLNMPGRYRVPLLILGPGVKSKTSQKVTQHSDIPETVLDLLELEGDLPLIGRSVFSTASGMAINLADGMTNFLVTDERVFTLDSEYFYDPKLGKLTLIGPYDGTMLKAHLQYFINGLINNNLSR